MFSRIGLAKPTRWFQLRLATRYVSTVPMILNGREVSTQFRYNVYSNKGSSHKLYDFCYFANFEERVDQICRWSQQGFEEWSGKSFGERKAVLKRVCRLLEQRKPDFITAHLDIGGPLWLAEFSMNEAIGQLDEYVGQMSRPEGVVPPMTSGNGDLAIVYRQPIGPVLSIAPWNAPVILGARSISGPLAAGCSVIVKSSELTPLTSYLLVKCFLDGGVPPLAIQLIHGGREETPSMTRSLIRDPRVKMVNFTGSTEVGRKISVHASEYFKPCLLELGGKNCSIVTPEADICKAVASIIWSSWAHMGQICMSTDSVYVHEAIYDRFLTELTKQASIFGEDQDYKIPQRDHSLSSKLTKLIQDALLKGAKILFGLISLSGDERHNEAVHPVILEGVNAEMDIDKTETFGPIMSVTKYSDADQLVGDLNSFPYGLKASIWSTDVVGAINMGKKLEVGGVHINSSTICDESTIPHGGVKSSGVGRFNSSWGIDSFSYFKTLTASS